MRRALPLTLVTTLLGAGLALGQVGPASAAACTIEQITDTTGDLETGQPSISDDGTRIAFTSRGEFGDFGDNADGGPEIWVYDTTLGPAETRQVSNSEDGNKVGGFPLLSGDGRFVAFRHNAELLPASNPDGNSEIWRYDMEGGPLVQVTNSASGDNVTDGISDNGRRIVLDTSANLIGGNPDQNHEIFLFDDPPSGANFTGFRTTTTGEAFGQFGVLSGSGAQIAINSDRDLTGDNEDLNTELFRDAVQSGVKTQVTDSEDDGNVSVVALNQTGNRILFNSNRDLVGQNAALGDNAFVYDAATDAIFQLTHGTGSGELGPEGVPGGGAFATAINDAGTRIAYQTGGDGANNIHVQDLTGHTVDVQITDAAGDHFADSADLDSAGTHVAFRSSADFTGANGDENIEIFLATCGAVGPTFSDVPASSPFYDQVEWMAAAGIASGFPNGTFKPQDPVKRQQMANFLYNLAGQPEFTPPVTPTFSDVPPSNPFYAQIEWMVSEEIASGFPGGLFKPSDVVKRQQMANFLYNLAGRPAFTPPGSATFSDVSTGSTFFGQVEWMVSEAIASGFPGGLFKPQDPVKRQQMANFLHNLAVGPGVDID